MQRPQPAAMGMASPPADKLQIAELMLCRYMTHLCDVMNRPVLMQSLNYFGIALKDSCKKHGRQQGTRRHRAMKTIPVFHAIHIRPFLDYCRREGLATEPSLRKYKLPGELCGADNIYLPQLAAYSAIDDIGQREGVHIAPSALARATIGNFGDAVAGAVASAPTLYTAIQRLQRIVKIQDPSLKITVRIHDDTAYLATRARNAEFHCSAWTGLMLLVNTVIVFASTKWQPQRITLRSPRLPGFDSRYYFPDAKIIWGAGQTSVSFPTALLGCPTGADNTREVDSASLLSLQMAIKGLIRAYLPGGSPKIEFIAEMAETRPRTLQRQLKQLGLSYSELVEQVRFEKASKLLRESDWKSLDIALELGYTDPSHFSRAFKRATGMTPREYRREYHPL